MFVDWEFLSFFEPHKQGTTLPNLRCSQRTDWCSVAAGGGRLADGLEPIVLARVEIAYHELISVAFRYHDSESSTRRRERRQQRKLPRRTSGRKESDDPLRRDVLHYIYEQTSNVHQHSEECTAAIMQCLTQLLNALEIGMHKTEGRVIKNEP
ncbi:hypothetical protein FOZ60_016243 [Perkinsus olseni]|uniref:Uncharacterized protein n=1 Tax=Perkinsus olseni TaxID=32597 RepID=A0A7J6N4B8_PEROL|nr:hypothetical protein FOZ60_016243 [Perkinsus olseni]